MQGRLRTDQHIPLTFIFVSQVYKDFLQGNSSEACLRYKLPTGKYDQLALFSRIETRYRLKRPPPCTLLRCKADFPNQYPASQENRRETYYSTMPSRAEVTYFGAGPAGLPSSVLEVAAQSLVDHEGTGLGLAEHSHRSELATNILNNTKADLAKYLDIPDDYEVLFMQGGGTGGFSATLCNFVGFWVERRRQNILKSLGEGADEAAVLNELQKAVTEELKVDYLVTGSWSLKASQEAARLLGPEHVNIAADSREANGGKFGKIPEESTWKLSKSPAMVYFCDNETVDGVEFPSFPKILEGKTGGEEPLVVADMSSNILSRRIPVSKFSVIFFGAQKNLGTTGITVVIIKKSLLPPTLATPAPKLMRQLGLPLGPIVLEYATIAKNNSLYNTLSIFDVFIAGKVLQSLLNSFPDKVDGQEAVADKKAGLIYAALDAYPDLYKVGSMLKCI
jgi:phosphoserine aminotransferase